MTTASETSAWRFALVGTPNSGKTALFNALTGSRQKVANYPGVTVERKAGIIQTPAGHRVDLIDLPGTYSLRGRSPDEEITRDVVLGRLASEAAPDLLLCVADATNLRVALRLVIELKQVGRPLMLVLNMIDIARRRGIEIDLDQAVDRARRAGGHVDRRAPRRHRGPDAAHRRDGCGRRRGEHPEHLEAADRGRLARRPARGRPHHPRCGQRGRRGRRR